MNQVHNKINMLALHFLNMIYEKMKRRYHINPDIEKDIEEAKVEFPSSLISDYSTIRNKLTRVGKGLMSPDLLTLTKTFIEETKSPTLEEIHDKIKAEYNLKKTSCDLEQEIEEVKSIITGKR